MLEAPLVGATGPVGATGAVTTISGTVTTRLTGDGITKNFVINGYNGTNPDAYSVSISGIDQLPGINYVIERHPYLSDKGIIGFSSAPDIYENILVRAYIGGLATAPAEYTGLLNPAIREKASFYAIGDDQAGFAKGEMVLSLSSAQIFVLQGTTNDYSLNVVLPDVFNATEIVSFTLVFKGYSSIGTKMFTSFKINGTLQSLFWPSGDVPVTGNPSGIDVFTFTILNNDGLSYTVFANRLNYVVN